MFPLRDNLPTDRPPVVTIALILLNAFVYFFLQPKTGIAFEGGLKQAPLVHYGAIPYEFTHWGSHCDLVQGAVHCMAHGGQHQLPTALTVFSGMFTHAGLLHLGGNMLFLYIFGNNVEDAMGPVRYLLFYLLGGIAALALQIAVGPDTTGPTLGASGAIAAVLGGYILIYPRARVLTLIFIIFFFTFIEIPAFFFLFIWFGEQAVFGAIGLVHHYGGGGGVAYFAHVGGFIFGLAAIRLFATRRSSSYGGPRYPVY